MIRIEVKNVSHRIEHDSMGQIEVPSGALYGAQTQRAIQNFNFSGRAMPNTFIQRLALIKAAAALTNQSIGSLSSDKASAIVKHALRIAEGEFMEHFPLDVFQTGSGTSTNMNMNEVLATLSGEGVHPIDDVNQSQSSNDVIPTCIQVSVALELEQTLIPAIRGVQENAGRQGRALASVVKTGRTHLMDAMPVTFQQELDTWAFQFGECVDRLESVMARLRALPLGGTAVGTGVNCHPDFPQRAIAEISRLTNSEFFVAENKMSRMAAQDVSVECSAGLRSLAIVLMKVSNDLRWMSSGPLAGLSEIELTALQPGSSIMPGKVNPVVPEAVCMIAAEVIGSDVTVGVAGQSGNFQLNVMLPLIADKLLTNIALCTRACDALGDTVADFKVNKTNIEHSLQRNPILVTALNSKIGYEAAAAIAKQAYSEGRSIIDIAEEATDLSRSELAVLLDPANLTHPEKTD
ncbi:MAG: fumarate hydratase class II [Candidatus Azotimanducaceae bacterium]|jgi:fumarate hydratase class II